MKALNSKQIVQNTTTTDNKIIEKMKNQNTSNIRSSTQAENCSNIRNSSQAEKNMVEWIHLFSMGTNFR